MTFNNLEEREDLYSTYQSRGSELTPQMVRLQQRFNSNEGPIRNNSVSRAPPHLKYLQVAEQGEPMGTGQHRRAYTRVEDRDDATKVEDFIRDVLNKIPSQLDMPGFADDPRMTLASENKFREYVTAYDERLKTEIRARRRRSPKQPREVAHPLVDGFLEKVRLQDQQLPEYLKESRAQRLPRGGQVGAGPGNLPAGITHAKAASRSMAFPPPAYQGMYNLEEEQGPSPADIQEMYAQNKASLKRLQPDNMELSSEAARTMLGQSRGPVTPEDHLNLMGQVVRADGAEATTEYPAQEIMFNTRPERVDDARRKPDVATMRISSFMINNNPVVAGLPKSEQEPAQKL